MKVCDKEIRMAVKALFSKYDKEAKVDSVQIVPGYRFYAVVITMKKKRCG